jgi:hypothetical protein
MLVRGLLEKAGLEVSGAEVDALVAGYRSSVQAVSRLYAMDGIRYEEPAVTAPHGPPRTP